MSFMEIFQPGLKHLREERQRQQHDIAYPTDGADPLVEINLDAGTATIVVPARGTGVGRAAPAAVSEPPVTDEPPAAVTDPSATDKPSVAETAADPAPLET